MKKDLNLIKLQKLVDNNFLSLGDLRKFLESNKTLLDSVPVVIERVEDKYFEGIKGWDTYKQPNDTFPKQNDEFIPAWCITKNNDGVVLIYSHY
jgi:hypothetical protein